MDNKTLRYTEVKIADGGEEAARLSAADRFSGRMITSLPDL
ncbi:hypothetical protein [Rossellomorea aquimaris]|nr:hypothetical protein [Rossellomorea aquimaris]